MRLLINPARWAITGGSRHLIDQDIGPSAVAVEVCSQLCAQRGFVLCTYRLLKPPSLFKPWLKRLWSLLRMQREEYISLLLQTYWKSRLQRLATTYLLADLWSFRPWISHLVLFHVLGDKIGWMDISDAGKAWELTASAWERSPWREHSRNC